MKKRSPLQRMFARKQRRTARRTTAAPAVLPVFVRSPYRCIILAIDPGENSGWAIFAHGKLVQFGEINEFDHAGVARIVQKAIEFASIAGGPIAMVIEKPFRGETGASRTLWRKAWSNAGCGARRALGEYPSRWRARLLGRGMGGARQARVREVEQQYARSVIARDGTVEHEPLGVDSAPAICIGAYAAMWPKLGKVLPIGVRRLSEVAA
jgi:hypothetical protein